MRDLIKAYNEMLRGIPALPGMGHVRYVEILGTLSGDLRDDAYQRDWGNELHPTKSGFRTVAKLFADAIP